VRLKINKKTVWGASQTYRSAAAPYSDSMGDGGRRWLPSFILSPSLVIHWLDLPLDRYSLDK